MRAVNVPRKAGDFSEAFCFNLRMIRLWVLAVPLAACNDIANPLYCDENSDCRNGTICNVDTHGCESVPSVDAMSDGVGPDGPYVARTVQEVRASSTPVETFVELTGVVVTAVDKYGPRTGEFLSLIHISEPTRPY